MPVQIASRRASQAALLARFPGAALIDVTSRGDAPWVRFSPFYPHGDILVPLWPGLTAASVEGIWQGLKVFERADADLVCLAKFVQETHFPSAEARAQGSRTAVCHREIQILPSPPATHASDRAAAPPSPLGMWRAPPSDAGWM